MENSFNYIHNFDNFLIKWTELLESNQLNC